MSPDELAAIRERDHSFTGGDIQAYRDRRALLAHIDAITEAVEGLDTETGPVDYGDGDIVYALGSVPKYRERVLAILRGETMREERDYVIGDLGAQWEKTKALIPQDWDLALYRLNRHRELRESGRVYAATASSPWDPETRTMVVISSEDGRPWEEKQDFSPTDALRALQAVLLGRGVGRASDP